MQFKKMWEQAYGRKPTEEDVEARFKDFVPLQFDCLAQYADLIPGTLEAVADFAHAPPDLSHGSVRQDRRYVA